MSSKSMNLVMFLTLSIYALLSAQPINSFSVELIHPNSPSNPYRNLSNNCFDWIRQAYNNSLSRAAAIQSRIGYSTKFKTDVKPIDAGGYVMKYSIGTPPFETYGIVDTSSDITWTQCEPCTDCFPQGLPIFDPKNSKSYKTVACDSYECSIIDPSQCSSDNICQYNEVYDDESITTGDVATDTLTIGNASFKNVVFGCGHKNEVTWRPKGTSGIFGLGATNQSIVKQLYKEIGGKFAYCMSPDPHSKGYISFGPDAVVKGAGAVSTPFNIHNQDPEDDSTYYWVTLESMSVGRKKIPVKQSSIGLIEVGNIIIDSGMMLTLLTRDVFTSLKSELMKQIPATPIDDPKGMFELCYLTSEKIKMPKMVAHFAYADVELSHAGTLEEVEEGISCFTIASPEVMLINVFGNSFQVNHLVEYDWEAMNITFKPNDCSKF